MDLQLSKLLTHSELRLVPTARRMGVAVQYAVSVVAQNWSLGRLYRRRCRALSCSHGLTSSPAAADGFRKVLSPMAGSLRNESDEMIFAHQDFVKDEPWGLENIKRKVSAAAAGAPWRGHSAVPVRCVCSVVPPFPMNRA